MNIIVCNLTRFGDLLQSQAVIDDLHEAGHEVDLVCLDNFAVAAPLLRNVRKSWPLNGGGLLARTESAWPLAAAQLANFAKELVEIAKPDCVINLTPGAAPRLLTRLLAPAGARVLGFGMDNMGFGVDYGVWTSFFSVAAGKRINSPFNLADMLRMMAYPIAGGMRGSFRLAPPDGASMDWARNFLAKAASGASGYVAFQLGASEERRRWPVEYFAELGRTLWDTRHLQPILLGSPLEKKLADEYAAAARHPFINAVGSTDIPKLAALTSCVRLLVTNDTGTMHLASGLGVPSLAFFFATAQPWDTGPMLPGCCCLEPALPCHPCAFGRQCARAESCRASISPATVAALASNWLETGKWEAGKIDEARVWLTARDAGGFYQIRPLCEAASNGPGLWLAWMRFFWRQLFDDMEAQDKGAPAGDLSAGYAGLRAPDDAARISVALGEGAGLLDIIADCAPAVHTAPSRLGQIFLRNCERLQAFWHKTPKLEALAAFWHEFRKNQGGDISRFRLRSHLMAAHARALAQALAAYGN